MSKVYLPEKFIEKYDGLLKEEAVDFFESCKTRLTKSVILNSLKTNNLNLKDIILEKVNYIDNAYFIKSETNALGNTIEHHIGLFQMQEVSSMLPAIVLNPKETDVVLDLTAAPGNKTGLLAQIMKNKGLIIANDVDKTRIKTLIFTLKKLGVTNTIVTCQNGINYNTPFLFDKILLDAPCSCEGMVRKKPDALKEWSEPHVLSKSELQKQLITSAFKLLKKNGELVYSTCTMSPEENEEVIDLLLKNTNAKIEEIIIPKLICDSGITEYKNKKYNPEIKKAIRIWPHKNNIEGFFICKIKKLE